jgi:hypothetical protein
MSLTPTEELTEAWKRILSDRAAAGDGAKAILWLRSKLMLVSPLGAQSCAVHDFEGQRRLAAELLAFAVKAETEDAERREARSDIAHESARQRAGIPAGQRPRGAARRVPS